MKNDLPIERTDAYGELIDATAACIALGGGLQPRGLRLEPGEGSAQVLDDPVGDDLRGGQVVLVFEVFEGLVPQPGDVEVGLVAGNQLFAGECLEPHGLLPAVGPPWGRDGTMNGCA